MCCPGLVYRSSRCAWLMVKLDLLNSGKNPDYRFLCLAVSRHWIALYRLDWPILGCFPSQTSSLTLTPLIPLFTECQDFEKMQAQHQRERENFTNCGLWHLQNQTFCRNSILPGSCSASDIYWKRSRGTWAALYTAIHSGPPSSPMSPCSEKGLQCGPKWPVLPLYLRVNPLFRFPVGLKDALEPYWNPGISFTTILSQTRCVIDFLNFFSAPCDKKD